MKKYKVVKKFRFNGNFIGVETIYKQDEDGDYYSFNIVAFGICINGYLPAAFVENNPEYFELVKEKSNNQRKRCLKLLELMKEEINNL